MESHEIEQRIGRIDRLGQERPVVRILNFAYKDTVEQDVFFTVGTRINLFHGIVGRLQPILSWLPRRFEELTLSDREAREAARQRFLADIEQQVRDVEQEGFDINATVEDSLELPPVAETPLSLRDLDRTWRPLDVGCKLFDDPPRELRAIDVTPMQDGDVRIRPGLMRSFQNAPKCCVSLDRRRGTVSKPYQNPI